MKNLKPFFALLKRTEHPISKIVALIIIISLLWFIIKSNKENTEKNKEKSLESASWERTRDSLINLDTLNYKKLKNKYDAVDINFDTTDFTYEIEDRIESSKKPLLLEGRIIDIINNKASESSPYKGLNQNKVHTIIAAYESVSIYKKFNIKVIVNINDTMFTKLIAIINKRKNRTSDNSEYFYFLINPKSFTTLFPILKAENGINEDNVELYYDIDEVVSKLEGTIIDFYPPHNQRLYQNRPSAYANL
jgi:hypothetical protein